MAAQTVTPAGKSSESLYLLIITVAIVSICAFLISLSTRGDGERTLQGHELDAFSDLNGQELAVFNNLRTSALEIDEVHRSAGNTAPWPTVAELEEEGLPPFVQDASWKKSGAYRWERILRPAGDIDLAVFVGYPDSGSQCGTMLLLFLHDHAKKQGNAGGEPQHAPYEIWYHASSAQPVPEVFTDQGFITAGWKEVKALRGADEIKRIKG